MCSKPLPPRWSVHGEQVGLPACTSISNNARKVDIYMSLNIYGLLNLELYFSVLSLCVAHAGLGR